MLDLTVTIVRNGDEAPWPELRAADTTLHHVTHGNLGVAILEAGMSSGRPSVALRVTLDDATVVIVETSLALFAGAVIAARGAFPEAFAGGPLAVDD